MTARATLSHEPQGSINKPSSHLGRGDRSYDGFGPIIPTFD